MRMKITHTIQERKALERAIAIVGSQKRLAQLCGVRQQAVQFWLKLHLPAERVLQVERAANGIVTRHELRPDIYPAE